jgi:hypothetical protein
MTFDFLMSFSNFYRYIPILVKIRRQLRVSVRRSPNIYRTKKCSEIKLCRKIKHTFYARNTLPADKSNITILYGEPTLRQFSSSGGTPPDGVT